MSRHILAFLNSILIQYISHNGQDQVIVSWNGLAISSFARASKILLEEPEGTQFCFPVVGTNVSCVTALACKYACFKHASRHNYDNLLDSFLDFLNELALFFMISKFYFGVIVCVYVVLLYFTMHVSWTLVAVVYHPNFLAGES